MAAPPQATAIGTAKMAFAPSLGLLRPHSSWSRPSPPPSYSYSNLPLRIMSLTRCMAFRTPSLVAVAQLERLVPGGGAARHGLAEHGPFPLTRSRRRDRWQRSAGRTAELGLPWPCAAGDGPSSAHRTVDLPDSPHGRRQAGGKGMLSAKPISRQDGGAGNAVRAGNSTTLRPTPAHDRSAGRMAALGMPLGVITQILPVT